MKRLIFFIMVILVFELSLYGYNDDLIKNDRHLLPEEIQRFDDVNIPEAITADSWNTYLVGRYDMASAYGLYVVGDYAYVADGWGLRVIDVSDPTNPQAVGYCFTRYWAIGVYVLGDYAYIADGDSGLCIIDVSDPTNPQAVGYYDTDGSYGVYVVGDYAYVADGGDGLYIIGYNGYILLKNFNYGLYYAGDIDTIIWSADTLVHQIELSYTTDNGNIWIVIDTVSNTGSYVWTIPDTPSDGCKIKLQSLEYGYIYDTSDNVFTISEGSINLSTFSYGTYYAGQTDTIKWRWTGDTKNVIIYYSADDGNTWEVADTVPNTGSYAWTIPNIVSDECKIKLQSLEYDSVYGISFSTFKTIAFTLNNPANNSTLERGNNRTIEWESYMSDVFMSIFYSMDGGSSWNIIADSTANDGEYVWYVDTDTLGSCLLKLMLRDNTTLYDDTTISVNIVDRIEITTPNGGEELDPNTTYRIEWRCDTTVEYVNIYYTTDRGATWNLIRGSVFASLGYYDWSVPDVNTGGALIKIANYEDSTIYDISDSLFIIGDNSFVGDLINIFRITIPTLSTNGISIKYELSNITPIKVKVYDTAGRLVKDEILQLGRGKNIYNIPINSKGIYFVKIYDSKGKLIGQSKVSVVK